MKLKATLLTLQHPIKTPKAAGSFSLKGNKMFKGTTPTYVFKTEADINLTLANNVYVTFGDRHRKELFTKTGEDIVVREKEVGVYLDQTETLSIPSGIAYAQLNWTYDNERRMCSNTILINVNNNLLNHKVE